MFLLKICSPKYTGPKPANLNQHDSPVYYKNKLSQIGLKCENTLLINYA